ncbi:GHKL domain-containing protein [Filobacillus milosensis]|uniref:histidine kinase n=1 Tax=Filobacillus milosensis TaxID=94137 RepID=A0A4Y8IFI6_9BACI|nr:HAMP domain-containing sensor histidine kinase [Filobacillus milosensis]TFB18536.1 GHKL domain-containing protein [Filobacillus milosensis]
MDIKWKNSAITVLWLLLFTYGLSGVLSILLNDFNYIRHNLLIFWIYTIGAIIAMFLSLIIYNKKIDVLSFKTEQVQQYYNKIPLDIAILLAFISSIITLDILVNYHYIYAGNVFYALERILYKLLDGTMMVLISSFQLYFLYHRIKDLSLLKQDWNDSLTSKFISIVGDAFSHRSTGTKIFMTLAFVFFSGMGLGLSMLENDLIIVIPFILFFGLIILFLIIKRVGYFNRIVQHANSISKGNMEPDLKVKGNSVLAQLANDINKLKYGVKNSQQAQAKSERLKTELITNVSHDLRTPLTSIMTYSELLKDVHLTEEERAQYIDIIDRKSNRLKVLIEDLFEASKMASGNMELEKSKVDLVQLFQQALAEYDDMIQESSIKFRVNTPERPVYAMVDGQKIWRVFDNLIENILKYSLKETRAYIQITQEANVVSITFKNISEYELSENFDELVERFKRGDESRHTDGSGLGLAISKSIIDLHEGEFDIDVDGDLFKVTIKLNSSTV